MITMPERPTTRPSEWTDSEWERLVDALSRRKLVSGGVALGLATILPDAAAGQATPAPDATRVIDTAMGNVEIPADPERVVCVNPYVAGILLDLGFTPVGVLEETENFVLSEYAERVASIARVGTVFEPDVEKIAELSPDLILGVNSPPMVDAYDRLSAVAPTVLLDYDVPYGYLQLADQFADAIGRTDELEALKDQYQDRVTAISSAHASILAETRWYVAWGVGDQWWLWYPDSSICKVLADAGVQFGSAVAGKEGQGEGEPFSYEQISLLEDADVIVTLAGPGGRPVAATQAFLDQPTFKLLKAAVNGHVYPLADSNVAGYRQALALLDEVEEVLGWLQDERR